MCITRSDVKKYMVITIENKEILPYCVSNIMVYIKDSILVKETSNNYLVNTNDTIIKDQLVNPVVKKGLILKKKGKVINVMIANETPRKMLIKRGKAISFAENISIEIIKSIYTIIEMFKQSSTLASTEIK